jgi:hypothetical protein
METFNLLFEALKEHGEDYMIIKLYERLIHYRLNPSYSICSIVMRLIDKKQILNKSNVINITKFIEKVIFIILILFSMILIRAMIHRNFVKEHLKANMI